MLHMILMEGLRLRLKLLFAWVITANDIKILYDIVMLRILRCEISIDNTFNNKYFFELIFPMSISRNITNPNIISPLTHINIELHKFAINFGKRFICISSMVLKFNPPSNMFSFVEHAKQNLKSRS